MSPSLDSLSVELLDNIVSFVQPHSALFQLALVSRKFNTLVTPYLYRHVFLDSSSSNGGRHILPLTFLILQKPYIASLVRSFTFRGGFQDEEVWSDPEDIDDDLRLPWPEHPDRDIILRQLVKKISHSKQEESEWLDEVLPRYAPYDDAILSILLISLPKLRRLDLEISDDHIEFLMNIFHRIASSEPPFDVNPVFTQLSDIMIAGGDDRYPTDYVLFGACCGFPAIKRLYGHRLGAEDDRPQLNAFRGATSALETSELRGSKLQPDERSQPSDLNSPTSAIESFELRDSKLHLSDLPIILAALKSPQTLIYHIGNSWAWTPIRTPDILSAFLIHATSVRRLAIDHEDYYPFEEGVGPDDNADPISFIGFIALTHLRVAPVFLFGHEDMLNAPEPESVGEATMLNRLRGALPLTLESLYVTHAEFVFSDKHAHLAKAFEILLQHKECVPHLREIVFEGALESQESRRRAGEMISVAKEMGLDARAITRTHYEYAKQRGWGWDEEESFEMCMHNDIGEKVQLFPQPPLKWQ